MGTESMAGGAAGRRYPSPLVKQDLAKLGKDAESRRAALCSIRTVVEEHLQGAALPRFLHQVEDSADGRRHAATIVSELARVHGDRLSPHIPRLLQILAHTLLASAASPSLQSDCAKAVAAIAKHSASTPSSAEKVLRRICLPLIALLPHKVELLSAGAAACLSALVESETWKFAAAPLISKLCLRAAMALACRSAQTVPHMKLLRSLASANASALAQFSIPLLRLLNQEILLSSSASWQLRLAAIHVLESLLKAAEQTTLVSQLGVSLQILAKCRLDKMPHVRKAAMNALRTADTLAAKGDMKRKLAEDLPQTFHSQTEPSSPLHHNLDSSTIEDLFKPTLLIPGSQRTSSHALLQLAPSTLSDLNMAAPPSKAQQVGIQTPTSDHSPGRGATTDDSDYFCAYFFDTKENVSCRKIVHHIHDTAIGSATPPNSPLPKHDRKVAVPPLPLSSVVLHDSGQTLKSKSGLVNTQSQSAVSTPSSFTRHVTVLDSDAELLASCERTLIFTSNCAEDDSNRQDPHAIAQTKPKTGNANAADEVTGSKSEAASDLNFIDEFAKRGIKQIFAEQRMQAMEDLQTISSRLLEITEGKEEEDTKEKQSRDEQEKQRSAPEHQGRIEAQCTALNVSVDGAETASHHGATEGCASRLEDEAVKSSSAEWSVRDNPIAEAVQSYHPPASQLENSGKCAEEETASDYANPITDAASALREQPPNHEDDGASEQESSHEMDEFEEVEEEATLESCDDGVSETENLELDTAAGAVDNDDQHVSRFSVSWDYGLPHHMISDCRKPSASLRSFLMRGATACTVIPIAMVTLAKLFQVELLPQHVFMPPT